PMTDRTDTSISSPIMMLWLDLRVRTNISVHLPLCRLGDQRSSPNVSSASIVPPPGERGPDASNYATTGKTSSDQHHSALATSPATSALRKRFTLVSRTVHASQIPAPAP